MTARLPGRASDSPGNTVVSAGRTRTSPQEGQIAVGHAVVGSPVPGDTSGQIHMPYHSTLAVRAADLATTEIGPLASSLNAHRGQATVVRMDQAAAASPTMAPQLGVNAPSGVPGQPGPHTAPINTGNPVLPRPGGPADIGLTGQGGQLQRGQGIVAAPGDRFSLLGPGAA